MVDKDYNLLILEKVKIVIDENIDKENNLGIASGISGIMIFRFFLARLLKCDKEFEKAKHLINIGVEHINNGYNNPTYSNGLAGFFWTLLFLEENNFIEIDDDSFFCQVEDFISDIMRYDIKKLNYDFLHGAIGYGVFFLKRYKNVKNYALRRRYKSIIEELVNFLEDTKIQEKNGIKWESPQESDIKNEINIDLGLSHGVPSILYFLCLVYDRGLFQERIYPIIIETSKYILSTKNVSKNIISLFPAYQYQSNKKEEHSSRLAWCYGDVGIGLSILKAAEVTKNKELKKEAIFILSHSSRRKCLKENSVLDAGLCHGAYGLFHIYGKLYNKTKINCFKESSKYWKEIGDDMIKYDENQNIFYPIHLGKRDWSKPYSLLEGISGIGLSIISNLTNYEIEWEECLFI
jgi:class I lanthipeptide synthase